MHWPTRRRVGILKQENFWSVTVRGTKPQWGAKLAGAKVVKREPITSVSAPASKYQMFYHAVQSVLWVSSFEYEALVIIHKGYEKFLMSLSDMQNPRLFADRVV